jgi:ubiquinone/menaquinone biosynthesis C-methylase UbiE
VNRWGYRLPAAPTDAWRVYDEASPMPGYFQFDWLSSRHPDLYHQFALSTDGLMQKLHTLIDLSGDLVIDVGAGTGRSARGAAAKAGRVFALDFYESVVTFGRKQLQRTNIGNVYYLMGDRDRLPFQDNTADVVTSSWAELNIQEAYRVLKPEGYLIQMGAVSNALCGELTSEIGPDYAFVPKDYAPPDVFHPAYPDIYRTVDNSIWNGIPVTGAINIHEFTYVADYLDYTELASIAGRLYGPKARNYFLIRQQSTFSWRLQIILGQVRK